MAVLNVTTPAVSVVNVPPGTYYVRALAVNGAGVSPPSNEVAVVVTAATTASAGARVTTP